MLKYCDSSVRVEQEAVRVVRTGAEVRHHVDGDDGEIRIAVDSLVRHAHQHAFVLQQHLHIQRNARRRQIVVEDDAVLHKVVACAQLRFVQQHGVGNRACALGEVRDVDRQQRVRFLLVQPRQLAGERRVIHAG